MEIRKNPKNSDWTRYTSLAFQMGITIFLGVFGGLKLDQYIENEVPVFLLIGSVLGVAIAIYYAIKDLIKK